MSDILTSANGMAREKQVQLAGWMLGDLNPHDKANRPSGNEFGHLRIRQEPPDYPSPQGLHWTSFATWWGTRFLQLTKYEPLNLHPRLFEFEVEGGG